MTVVAIPRALNIARFENSLAYPLPSGAEGVTATAGASMTLFTTEGASPAVGFLYDVEVLVLVHWLVGYAATSVTIADHDGANPRVFTIATSRHLLIDSHWRRGIRFLSGSASGVSLGYSFLGRRQRRARL